MKYDDLLKIDNDLLALAAYALVTVLFSFLPVIRQTPVSFALGLGMVLFVTGYAIIVALFPRREGPGTMERVALSSGLSVMAAAFAALALYVTPLGFSPEKLYVCLAIITVACTVIAHKRRQSMRPARQLAVDTAKDVIALFSKESPMNQALIIVLALAILMTTSALAYAVMVPAHGEPFTEFYVLGPDGKAGNYSDKLYPGEPCFVTAGIASHEYRDMTYDLVVTLNDGMNTSTLYEESIRLASGQTWEKMIELKPDLVGKNEKIEFLLYADGNYSAPYRELRLWVDVTPPL